MAPTQVKLLPIGEEQHEYARNCLRFLEDHGIRCQIDERNEKIGYKIRQAQLEKVPYMLIIGERELEENQVSVRTRKGEDLGDMTQNSFLERILPRNPNVAKITPLSLYNKFTVSFPLTFDS